MKIHDLIQGSPEWKAYRAQHWNASDAPVMMGVSTNKTRSQLLNERHLGLEREFSDFVQERVIDPGYAFEAQARVLAELIAGGDAPVSLYPVTGSEGRYSASFDGITMDEDLVWEHKTLNESLRAAIRQQGGNANDFLAPIYQVQLEQQLMVSGASRALFMATKWSEDGTLIEERHCWYKPDLTLRKQIVAGWEQFEADLAVYVPPEAEKPKPVGATMESLPALQVLVEGAVTKSNLSDWVGKARALVASISTKLDTDEDFATAENMVKGCEKAEQLLEATKSNMLAQTVSIDEALKTIDLVREEFRQKRLALDKLVKARKESIKGEIVAGAVAALGQHLQSMNCPYLPRIAADFAGVIKNKRTVASLQDAVDTELARVKIEANGHYQRIQQSLQKLEQYKDHAELFADVAALMLKAPDDLLLVIRTRIDDDMRRKEKMIEAERERIRVEEAARADREAITKIAQGMAGTSPLVASAAPVRTAAPVPAPKVDEPATLNLTVICERLGFTVNAAFVGDTLGITGAPGSRGSKLFTEHQFGLICSSIAEHTRRVHEAHLAAA